MDVRSYIKAARLRTLPLSISGIIVGSFLAVSAGLFNWLIFLVEILVEKKMIILEMEMETK
ncbi:hypothetical protein N9771_03185 [Flavobacteriaceae bacterium]|nr:hypothetical protein [Flavobacteriaceae bacterium]